ncbi:MAG: hypothetical protein R3D58_23600 [Saprospiraceae bacterium]
MTFAVFRKPLFVGYTYAPGKKPSRPSHLVPGTSLFYPFTLNLFTVKKALFTLALICSLQIHLFSRRLLNALLSKARLFLTREKLDEMLVKAKLSESDINDLKSRLKKIKQDKQMPPQKNTTHATHLPGIGQISESELRQLGHS